MGWPIDALIYRMRGFAGSRNAWEAGFAKSILKQASRPGWEPTSKQKLIMERMVSEVFLGDGVVIEDE